MVGSMKAFSDFKLEYCAWIKRSISGLVRGESGLQPSIDSIDQERKYESEISQNDFSKFRISEFPINA